MISKLPRWVESGAFVLALVAGFINAAGLLGFQHQSVSHLSGTATLVGTGFVNSSMSDVFYLFAIIFSFLIGSAISGYFLHGGTLKLSRNYSGVLTLEAIFLFCAAYLLTKNSFGGLYWASAACGLQNALATKYSGAVIRTTHVTGIFTDLGIMLGAKIRGEQFDKRKALLFLLIILGFISGGALGAYSFNYLQFYALYVPASFCLFLALSYSLYRTKVRR
ncbi:YoaK family protein [Photobacterium minamisatsumaniensis]|uniref:YoaK family protein n=1 Tax=Photobacterium minamisatsumaniensis TaxID=2910233 RepID=UPI003D098F4D